MVNEVRSSGSNYHPCSQKRKISIGVIAESPNKPESIGVKDGQATEKRVSKSEGLGIKAAVLTKQCKASEQRSSPWISTRPFENSPIFVDLTKQPSNIEADANSTGFIPEARTLEVHSVRICSKFSPSKQYQSSKVRKLDKENEERSKGTSEITERPSVARRALAERRNEENTPARTANTSTNALKLRLRELLGTVSSQKGNNNVNCEEKENRETEKLMKKVVKQRHNSDTIESDSEAVDRSPKRPVTRMLSRKILSSKKGEDSKSKERESSSYKHNHADTNLSLSDAMKSINPSIVKGSSLLFDIKKREGEKKKASPYKTRFAESGSATKNVKSPAKNTESFLEEISFPLLSKEGRVELKKGDEQKNIQSPAREEIDKLMFSNTSLLAEQGRLNEKADFESPTFGFEASFRNAFHNSPSSSEENETGSHVLPKGKLFGDVSPPTTSPLFKPNRITQSSDETEEPLSTGKSVHSGQEVEAGNTLQEVSEGSRNSENSKDDSPIVRLKGHTAIRTSCQFSIFETETISRREGPKFDDIGTPSPSKDNEEHRGLHLEQDKEDGLNRIVVLFSSALERFEVKMKAVASRKILEILKSVSEGICTQLQSVESQIQADMTNVMSSSKLKRKRLEARYEEQQEIMRKIQQKYKDDITQHFRNCKNTLEGLAAHQSEFKKIVERQRASHRKILAQVEEAIQTHLSEGDRRITTIHARVSKQMRQLKQMIAECLKDSLFT